MSLTVTKQPNEITLSKNPIEWCFVTDNLFEQPGGKATITIEFAGDEPVEEDTLTIDFGTGTTLLFTFKDAPDDSGLQLPTNPTALSATDYYTLLQDYFEGNEYIFQNFTISFALGPPDDFVLIANQTGLADFTTTLVSALPNWSVTSSAGADSITQKNFKVALYLCVEDSYLSGDFNLKNDSPLLLPPSPITTETCFDLSTLITSCLKNEGLLDIPECSEKSIKIAPNTNKRYIVKYAERYGGETKRLIKSDIKRALWGGLDYMRYPGNQFLLNELPVSMQFLTWKPNNSSITCIQPEYLTYLVFSDTVTSFQARVTVYDATGATHTYTPINLVSPAVTQWEKYNIPITPDKIGLNAVITDPVKFDIWLIDQDGNTISKTRTYHIECHTPDTRYFMFVNSLGGIDTIRTQGDRTLTIESKTETAQRTLKPDYNRIKGEFYNYCTTTQNKYKLTTENVNKCTADWYEELLLRHAWSAEVSFCGHCCEITNDNCIYIPILVTSKTIKINENEPGLFRLAWDYEQAFLNNDYNPEKCNNCAINLDLSIGDCDLSDNVEITIAVTALGVVGDLQIFINFHPFEIINPSEPVTVTVPGGGGDFVLEINDTGNEQCRISRNVQIPNCDTNTDPVAIQDFANTCEEEAVTLNVLQNDYDPDGGPISIISLVQPANGTVVDNLDGTFTYTPNAAFTGIDTFTYTISDGSGGEDTALVSITVSTCNPCEECDIAITSQETTQPDPSQPLYPNNGSVVFTVDGCTAPLTLKRVYLNAYLLYSTVPGDVITADPVEVAAFNVSNVANEYTASGLMDDGSGGGTQYSFVYEDANGCDDWILINIEESNECVNSATLDIIATPISATRIVFQPVLINVAFGSVVFSKVIEFSDDNITYTSTPSNTKSLLEPYTDFYIRYTVNFAGACPPLVFCHKVHDITNAQNYAVSTCEGIPLYDVIEGVKIFI